MKTISNSLTDNDMIALAAFYSTQAPDSINAEEELIKKGEQKYGLCWGCHGEQGEGPGSYPRIAGQNPA